MIRTIDTIRTDAACAALVAEVAHTGALTLEQVCLPGSGEVMDVVRPVSIDPLLDQVVNDPEQNLPYWAEIWPSGIGLAAELLAKPGLVTGRPVIELGSGLGITAAAAMRAGAALVATDYAPESLTLTRLTCQLFTGRQPETRQVNWRDEAAALLQPDGAGWPVVLAADVVYEQRDIVPVLQTLARITAPGGVALLAEPGRRPSRIAVEAARVRGWLRETTTWDGPWPDPKDDGGRVFVHRLTFVD